MNDAALARSSADAGSRRWRLGLCIPMLVFAVLAAALGWGLTTDPKSVPSTLIGKPAPEFSLPPVEGGSLGLSTGDLKGEASLVNVFASWCTACLQEHPLFMQLNKEGVIPIHGLNYKDSQNAATRWLSKHGNPYTRTGADVSGRVGIEWGVYGVPETFIVGPDGRIRYKQIGPITPEILEQKLMPVIRRLQRQ